MRQLTGRVLNFSNSPIAKADIVLRDTGTGAVTRLTTDQNGDFSYSGDLTGTFHLRVFTPEYAPMQAQIHVDPAAANSSFTIAPQGYCSQIRGQ